MPAVMTLNANYDSSTSKVFFRLGLTMPYSSRGSYLGASTGRTSSCVMFGENQADCVCVCLTEDKKYGRRKSCSKDEQGRPFFTTHRDLLGAIEVAHTRTRGEQSVRVVDSKVIGHTCSRCVLM